MKLRKSKTWSKIIGVISLCVANLGTHFTSAEGTRERSVNDPQQICFLLLKKSQGTHPTKVYLHIHDYLKYLELEVTGFFGSFCCCTFFFFFTFKITENETMLSMWCFT